MAPILGENATAEPESLDRMRERTVEGDRWAAYQNHDMGSRSLGHLVFLVVGPTRTLKEPPERAPDGAYGMGWRYLHVGFVDMETGQVKP